jgi:hypothetical protein
MMRIAVACLVGFAMLHSVQAIEVSASSNAANTTYLDVAVRAANWIVDTAIQTPQGVYWPDDLIGQSTVSYNRSLDLYSGVSGCVVFLLEIYHATGNVQYLNTAVAGAKYIQRHIPGELVPKAETSLYHGGLSGLSFVLEEVYQQTGDASFHVSALQVCCSAWESGSPTRCDCAGARLCAEQGCQEACGSAAAQ